MVTRQMNQAAAVLKVTFMQAMLTIYYFFSSPCCAYSLIGSWMGRHLGQTTPEVDCKQRVHSSAICHSKFLNSVPQEQTITQSR